MDTNEPVRDLKKLMLKEWMSGIAEDLEEGPDERTLRQIGAVPVDLIDEVRGPGDGTH